MINSWCKAISQAISINIDASNDKFLFLIEFREVFSLT